MCLCFFVLHMFEIICRYTIKGSLDRKSLDSYKMTIPSHPSRNGQLCVPFVSVNFTVGHG